MESRKDKKMLEARVGIEPTDKGFADPVVTRLSPFHSISDWQPRTVLSGSCPPAGSLQMISAVPPSFNPTVMKRLEGRPVVRFAEQLHLHRVLDEFGWVGVIDELNEAARPKNQSMPEPILITTNGTILAGFEHWRLAVFEARHEVYCIEYPLGEDESLRFILTYHRPRRGWNAFVRVRVALTLEPYLQRLALDNMHAGGKCKGLASLPNVQPIDVRQEIARIAAVGARSVSNVKTILRTTHPKLIGALQEGTLTINRAIQFCKLPRAEQLERFIRYSETRAIDRVIRRSTARPKEEKISLDVVMVLEALQHQEAQQPGSVAVRVGRHERTVVLIGQDLFAGPLFQEELELI